MRSQVRSAVQASEMKFSLIIEGVTLFNKERSSEIRKFPEVGKVQLEAQSATSATSAIA